MILPEEALPLLRQQRTFHSGFRIPSDEQKADAMRVTHIRREMQELHVLLKSYEPDAILDFGCGIGVGLVALRELFPNARLYGVDSTGAADDRSGMSDAERFWNDLDITRAVLELNEVDATVVDIKDALQLPRDIDVAISLTASGWHWPLRRDLPLFDMLGVHHLIVDLRKPNQTADGFTFIRQAMIGKSFRHYFRRD